MKGRKSDKKSANGIAYKLLRVSFVNEKPIQREILDLSCFLQTNEWMIDVY